MRIYTSKRLQKAVDGVQSHLLQPLACGFVSGDMEADAIGLDEAFDAGMRLQAHLQKVYDKRYGRALMYKVTQELEGGNEDVFYFCGDLETLIQKINKLTE